jgi:hypothetical protein
MKVCQGGIHEAIHVGVRLFCLCDQAALTPAFLGESRVTGIRHQNLNCTQARHARLVSALVPFPLHKMPSRENRQRQDYRERCSKFGCSKDHTSHP